MSAFFFRALTYVIRSWLYLTLSRHGPIDNILVIAVLKPMPRITTVYVFLCLPRNCGDHIVFETTILKYDGTRLPL